MKKWLIEYQIDDVFGFLPTIASAHLPEDDNDLVDWAACIITKEGLFRIYNAYTTKLAMPDITDVKFRFSAAFARNQPKGQREYLGAMCTLSHEDVPNLVYPKMKLVFVKASEA